VGFKLACSKRGTRWPVKQRYVDYRKRWERRERKKRKENEKRKRRKNRRKKERGTGRREREE
jgi:hypothetical protein